MTHKEVIDKIGSVKIAKLFWIAAQMDNEDLKELLEEMYDEDWEKLFPEIYNSDSYQEYVDDEEFMQALIDYEKIGFLAEIHIPKRENFTFSKDGKPRSWSSYDGVCRVKHVYAETIDLLVAEIEREDNELFLKDIEKDKSKKPNQ